MVKPLVSIIILNLNGEKYLKHCLNSVLGQSYENKEIIFIDNGSTDNSVFFVKKNYPDFKIIVNKKNVGFAEGNNQGFGVAQGEYIATLNNDTIVDKYWLERLVSSMQASRIIGMCASKIISLDNPSQIDSIGLAICLDGMARGRGRLQIDRGQYDNIKFVLMPSACAALWRRKMLEEIGFFDENFFAYCEDEDLGLRGRLAGWQAAFAPQAIVRHYYSGTAGKYSPLKAYLVERNHAWVVIKNFPLGLVILFPILTLIRFCFQLLAILQKRGAAAEFIQGASIPNSIKIIFKAYWEILIKLPKFIKKRKIVQSKRRLSNKEFYALIAKDRLSLKELIFKN